MKTHVKRIMSLALTFALVVAIPLAFTQEASAASGSKVKQPVMITQTEQTSSGVTTETTTYVYDKNGLNTEIVDQDGYKTTFTYTKKGLPAVKNYLTKTGEVYSFNLNTVKKGKVASTSYYDKEDGKDVLYATATFTYKKGKKASETYTRSNGKYTYYATYKPNGKYKKEVATWAYSDGNEVETCIYDKKGNITSIVYTDSEGTSKTTYKNTYKKGKLVKTVESYTNNKGVVTPGATTVYSYKKGKVVKSVRTYAYTYNSTDSNGAPVSYTDTTTTTTTYAYSGSLPKRITKTTVSVDGYDNSTTSRTSTTVISYKKIKVNKKAVKAVKESVNEFAKAYTPYVAW